MSMKPEHAEALMIAANLLRDGYGPDPEAGMDDLYADWLERQAATGVPQ